MIDIANQFSIDGKVLKVEDYANGLVNKTYLIVTTKKKYLMQKINHYVFRKPDLLMNNIFLITNYLKEKGIMTLSLITTKKNELYYQDEKGYYRCYEFVEQAENIHKQSKRSSYEIGKVIGEFQSELSFLNPNLLVETIHDFHHTPKRIEKLKKVYLSSQTNLKRKEKVRVLYEYIMSQTAYISQIQLEVDKGLIPLHIVHNDTKMNNILFDKKTKKAVCLVDLDTVMPGIALFDYADAVRTTAASVKEDEVQLDKITFKDDDFVFLTVGYLSQMKNRLTEMEIEHLVQAIGTITLECAIRFLTDYLENDIYFKTDYTEHNYYRALNQVKLYQEFRKKEEKWTQVIQKIRSHIA